MYGGAFNPPTIAHHRIILEIKKQYPNDQLIIVPVGDHYNKPALVSFNHRQSMLKAMDASLTIIDLEQHIPFKGTIHTLDYLKKTYQEDVGFIIGADQLEYVHTWIDYETLFKTYEVIIVTRPNYEIHRFESTLQLLGATYHILPLSMDVSSTSFRGSNNKNALTKPVLKYIKKHHLYEGSHV